jgi:hypothetical protein
VLPTTSTHRPRLRLEELGNHRSRRVDQMTCHRSPRSRATRCGLVHLTRAATG